MKFSPHSVDKTQIKKVTFSDVAWTIPGIFISLAYWLFNLAGWVVLITVFSVTKLYYRDNNSKFKQAVLLSIILTFLPSIKWIIEGSRDLPVMLVAGGLVIVMIGITSLIGFFIGKLAIKLLSRLMKNNKTTGL